MPLVNASISVSNKYFRRTEEEMQQQLNELEKLRLQADLAEKKFQ